MDRFVHFGRRLSRTVSMLTAIVLLGSVVSSPVTLALAVMPLAASPTFLDGITCDVEVTDDTRLQAAIASSVDDSVICIRESIQLSATLTLANTSVALVGRDDSAVTLTAPPTARHIAATATVPGDDTLVIDTLTLRGGNVPAQGGIVVNNYAIEIRDSSLRENNALGRGGALDVGGIGSVIITDTVFLNNTAAVVDGGGAIFVADGDVTIDDSAIFTGNVATGDGGAIFLANGDVTASGGTFAGNVAHGSLGGGAIYAPLGKVTITGTTAFTDNDATHPLSSGGAIYARFNVTTSGGTFSDNTALRAGGAIFAILGKVSVDDSTTFTNNSADDTIGLGGAIYASGDVTTSGGTFTDNTAGNSGGAIYSAAGRVTIDDTASPTDFSNNAATNGSGGAIYADDTVTTSGGTFTNNTADGALGRGGAIWAGGPISVTNSTLFGNSADRGGAAWSSIAISLRYTTAVDDSTTAGGVFESVRLTILGSVIAPDLAGGSACSRSADDSSYNSFVTDSSCGSGDDTVVGNTSRADIGLSGPLVTDNSTGAQVLIPDDTSILINAAPSDLVAGVTTDQLQATRGHSPDDSTTVGAVQVLPLVITGQPASTTVAAGATATFAASGLPGVGTTVNYQWQTRANAGASWVDRVGATSPTLTLASVSAGQNGLQVRALVSDIRDEPLTSSIATLTVTSSPGPGPGPAVVPGAPRDPKAVPGNEGAEVTWLAPLSSGTYPITSYEVVNDINGNVCRLTDGPNTALSCAMTGLTNGTSYRFRVRAISSAGAGEWSPWSNAVTPSAPPTPRTLVITGTRDGAKVRIRGASTGLSGAVAAPWVRLAGQVGYKQGINVRPIAANGSFNWSRTSLRKTYVYFTADGIVSNRVIFPSAR